MLPHLVSVFRAHSVLRTLERNLPRRKQAYDISGLPGSSAAVLVAALNEDLPPRVILLVAPNPTEAEMWYADLNVFGGHPGIRGPRRIERQQALKRDPLGAGSLEGQVGIRKHLLECVLARMDNVQRKLKQ